MARGKKQLISKLKEQFIINYVLQEQKNATAAAIEAGYSEKTATQKASSLLKDEVVRTCVRVGELIKQELTAVNPENKINNDFVMKKRIEILNSSLQKIPKKVWDYDKREYVDNGGSVILDGNTACKVLNDIERSIADNVDDKVSEETINSLIEVLKKG